jgi:hypothetical protein
MNYLKPVNEYPPLAPLVEPGIVPQRKEYNRMLPITTLNIRLIISLPAGVQGNKKPPEAAIA